MKIKNIVLTILVSSILLACGISTNVNASNQKELGILSLRESGYGYQVNNRNVWKIVEYNNGTYTYDNTYYCLKGGKGFGNNTYIENRIYNISYDLKKISAIPNTIRPILPSDVEKTFEFDSQNYKYSDYNAVLWLLDNMYLPKDANSASAKDNLLKQVFPTLDLSQITLTDDDIEVLQQLAIWYFTNVDETNTEEYAYHLEILPAIQLTRQEGGLGPFDLALEDLDSTWTRQDQAAAVYEYLIINARINAEAYGTGDDRSIAVVPAELTDTDLKVEIAEGKAIVGPFRIKQNTNTIDYNITGTLTNQNNGNVEYKLLDQNKQAVLEGTSLKDLANQNFYLEIDDNKEITRLTFDTTITYNDTETIFWTVGGSEILEQPVVEVKKIERNMQKDLTVQIDRKEFDLSLRKFITAISDSVVNRVPEVDLSGLETGTTAIYEHSKMPLSVTVGDIVKYKIRIYNEGEIDGYAEQIADYIPEGLGFIIGHNINSDNHWVVADGQSINTVKLTTIPNATNNLKLSDFEDTTDLNQVEVVTGRAKITTNKLKYNERDTQHSNLIPAYDSEQKILSSKDLEIVCVVLADLTQETNLKNIAEISKAVDKSGYVIEDRDSTPDNVNINTYPDNTNVQDDDDFERLITKDFDLALRKFITQVGDKEITDRKPIPKIDVATGEITYEHPKDVVRVKNGDLVTYTIRVYNEGSLAGYAKEVRDTLPDGLEFVADNEINKQYKWVESDDDNKTITTTYLSKDNSDDNLISAFDKGTMNSPEYKDLKVVCKVNVPNNASTILINTAEIEDDSNGLGGDVEDKDSTPGNDVEGEDDIDTEKVQIIIFDLSLKKFITEVNENQVTDRIPNVTIDSNGNLNYTYKKDPIQVQHNDIVIYTIRVYNEGNINGYAEEIKDDVPEGLIFLPEHETNIEYKWKLDEKGMIRTDYLSSENSEDNELDAFDKETMNTPDYRDVKVAFKVDETSLPDDRTIINTAEISKDSNEFDADDEDSTPDNDAPLEDDIDKEYLVVKYFDLALLKYITQVIIEEDGKARVVETGHTGLEKPEPLVKVEINKKKLDTTKVKFVFTIKVTNEGEIAGYAKEIIDRVPEGLEFVASDNPNWSVKEDGSIVTRQLEETLLNPGESATVDITLRWISGENNLGEKINWAEINEDDNDSGAKDIDSTPGNDVRDEDDIDDASVILSIKTGIEPSYISVIGISLLIMASGTFLIRKFILA